AEDARTPDRLAEDLVQQCQLQLAVSLPAEFGAEVAGPQTLVTYGLLHRGDHTALLLGERPVDVVRPQRIQLVHLVGHERVGPVQQLLELWFDREIPAHTTPIDEP